MAGNADCQVVNYSEFLRLREECVSARAQQRCLQGGPEGSFVAEWFRAEAEFDQQFLSEIDLGIAA